jgi:ferrous iron transport protein A
VYVSLKKIPNGTRVVVREIIASALKVKLMEMGIMEGKEVKVLYRAPFGDPMAVDLGGYILSLRNDEAELIQVETLDPTV